MSDLTEKDLDQLCLDACEFIGFASGTTVPYDPAGYDRIERIQMAPGSLKQKDSAPESIRPLPPQAQFDKGPYPARIAGFQRRAIFGPDEIGEQIARRSIAWNDGLGNGLYESLRIDRKYGLKHVLEAPTLGFKLPYLPQDWETFEKTYSKEVERFVTDLRELEPIYGEPLAESGDRMMVLWCQHYPLSLFAEAYSRDPEAVKTDLIKEIGIPNIPVHPKDSSERAALAKFMSLVRRRQANTEEYQAAVLRRVMGNGLRIVANPHELPPLDMELQGKVYDYPAIAIRPLLVDDDVMLRHYVAYFTQFCHDLTGKPPMVSIRMNLSAASPRFVPTPNLIRHWYDQAVRHGAAAFYFWTRDYPYSDDPSVYDGPMPGNPDPSAIGKERWQAVIDQLGLLAGRQHFVPPTPEVAIIVPNESALLFRQEWRRIYAVYSALSEAKIHTGFISDREIAGSGVPLGVKLLLAPAMEFVSEALRKGFETFTARGGILLVSDLPLADETGSGSVSISGVRPLDPAKMEIFPLSHKAELADLQQLSETLIKEVRQAGADTQSWVFDVSCANLPPSEIGLLRKAEPDLRFDPWLYEHGSAWIMPYL
jgi:hypothetical protein